LVGYFVEENVTLYGRIFMFLWS